jgi:hypothetical protein
VLIYFIILVFSPNILAFVRFFVLMAVSLKMTVFWDVVPCSLAKIDEP